MRFSVPMVLGAAALAVAFGAPAASDSKESAKTPGFNDMDKDNDGMLSRAEAKANPKLAAEFKNVDSNGDGKLSRMEYLGTMAAQDFDRLRSMITPGGGSSASTGSSSAGSSSAGGSSAGGSSAGKSK